MTRKIYAQRLYLTIWLSSLAVFYLEAELVSIWELQRVADSDKGRLGRNERRNRLEGRIRHTTLHLHNSQTNLRERTRRDLAKRRQSRLNRHISRENLQNPANQSI